jgi:hypothetical protein
LTTTEQATPPVTQISIEALPYLYADLTPGTLWIWIFQVVMQHSETPLTPKTLEFIDAAYKRAMERLEGAAIQKLEVVK